VKTIRFAHNIVARKGLPESTVASYPAVVAIRQGVMAGVSDGGQRSRRLDTDKDCRVSRAPGRKRLRRRARKKTFWTATAISLVGSDGALFRDGLRRRGVAGYLKKDEAQQQKQFIARTWEHVSARAAAIPRRLDQMPGTRRTDIPSQYAALLRARRIEEKAR